MPPSPIRPMNSPCPIHSGQGGPSVEIDSPSPIISAPTDHGPACADAVGDAAHQDAAGAGAEPGQRTGERRDRTRAADFAAMSLSATAVIQAAPNAIIMMNKRYRGDDPGIPGLDRGR